MLNLINIGNRFHPKMNLVRLYISRTEPGLENNMPMDFLLNHQKASVKE